MNEDYMAEKCTAIFDNMLLATGFTRIQFVSKSRDVALVSARALFSKKCAEAGIIERIISAEVGRGRCNVNYYKNKYKDSFWTRKFETEYTLVTLNQL